MAVTKLGIKATTVPASKSFTVAKAPTINSPTIPTQKSFIPKQPNVTRGKTNNTTTGGGAKAYLLKNMS